MTRPRISSEYASINDTGKATGTITLTSSQSIASGANLQVNTDVALSGTGALRLLVTSSKNPTETYSGSRIRVYRTWSLGVLDVIIIVYRLNATTVRISMSAFNSYGSTITAPSGDEVFTVSISNVGMPY